MDERGKKRYIPVRDPVAATKALPLSKVPRPTRRSEKAGAAGPQTTRGASKAPGSKPGPSTSRQSPPAGQSPPRAGSPPAVRSPPARRSPPAVQSPPARRSPPRAPSPPAVRSPPATQHLAAPSESPPPGPKSPTLSHSVTGSGARQVMMEDTYLPNLDLPVNMQLIIPVRQARPPSTPLLNRRQQQQPQPPNIPPTPQHPVAGGNPLAQPRYGLDWLPEDEMWMHAQQTSVYADEQVEARRHQEFHAARETVAAGTPANQVLCPDDVLNRFLGISGYEEDEAEQRETEYFEKLEQMIADEAEDIELALTLSKLDINKQPRRATPPTLDGQQQKEKFRKGLHNVQKGVEAMTTLAEEDEPEEAQPELAAAMMYIEECGPGMTNSPKHMFTFLFSRQDGTDSAPEDPSAEAVEDSLQAKEVTKHFNVVQMCGSCPPPWFRGYFEAFPHTLGKIAISKSASVTLQTAWYLMRPETFNAKKRMTVAA